MNLWRESVLAGLLSVVGACGDADPVDVTVAAPADWRAAISDFGRFTTGLRMRVVDDAGSGDGVRVTLVGDLDCGECFRIDGSAGELTVHAGGLLGAQYGLAQALEEGGVRFFHPWRSRVPARLTVPDDSPVLGQTQQAAMTLRSLHLHTLHPIEAYFDFWEPGETHLEGARRTIDWVVKNRGNHVQWVALGDITDEPGRLEPWRTHTQAIVEYAHSRGVRVGLGIQLFGKSNLQNAFDLLDDDAVADPAAVIRERLQALAGLGFDTIDLSFGEFFAADAQAFVDMVNLTYTTIEEVLPGVEVGARIHVGNSPDLRVDYMNENLLYYFLVKFANPAIVPVVHTVMYYNLFEPAAGAYHHTEFDEHRAFLLARIAAGERVAYNPESAYWVAFDDSVPMYLPVYVSSRWTDLAMTPGLKEHVLFSTGWEWGYWQNDYATLRMNWALPDSPGAVFEQMFGAALGHEVAALAELQHEYLIRRQLGTWLQGRDVIIDAGAGAGIVSQPPRLTAAEVAALGPTEKAAFEANVLAPLGELATETEAILLRVRALAGDDRFDRELVDSVELAALRSRFAADVWAGRAAEAAATLADARVVVERRHQALHDPDPSRLLVEGATNNRTIYPFGYLYFADALCYWERELAQVRTAFLGETVDEPGCFQL